MSIKSIKISFIIIFLLGSPLIGQAKQNIQQLTPDNLPHFIPISDTEYSAASSFIEHDMDLNAINKDGDNTLHAVAKTGNLKIAKLIVEKGTIDIDARNRSGNTALDVALIYDNREATSLILELKPNVDIINQNGDNALHLATKRDYLKVMRQILDLGIDINFRDANGNTAFFNSVMNNNKRAVSLLIDYGANPNIPNKTYLYNTPIHFAMSRGYQTLVLKMLDMETIDVNIQNVLGDTTLHQAGKTGDLPVLRKLFKKDNLEFYIENKEGLTAHQEAIKHYQHKAITLFENYEIKLLIHKRNKAEFLKNKNQNSNCKKAFEK